MGHRLHGAVDRRVPRLSRRAATFGPNTLSPMDTTPRGGVVGIRSSARPALRHRDGRLIADDETGDAVPQVSDR